MRGLGFCTLLSAVLASAIAMSAQAPASRIVAVSSSPRRAAPAPAAAPEVFKDYCFECHGTDKPKGDLSLERLTGDPSPTSVGTNWKDWEKVVEVLESGRMPPDEATLFPSDAERKTAATWIRSSLKSYEDAHAGEPGRVTVRRLTSAEYAYAIRDLTGIDIKVAIDASSDSRQAIGFAKSVFSTCLAARSLPPLSAFFSTTSVL